MKYVLQRRFETAPPPQNCRIARESKGLSFSRKIKGFTLAEVLITLGIIGVVAAMTIPTLIHKFNNKALETQYKKSVSIVSQVIMKAKADFGIDNFAKYCSTYIISEDLYPNKQECHLILYKSLLNVDGQTSTNDKKSGRYISRTNDVIRTYNNKQTVTETALAGIGYPIFGTYVMNDGSYINFYIIENELYIGVDTNGGKKPNRLGHDIFVFRADQKNDAITSGVTNKPTITTDEEYNNLDPDYEEWKKERYGNPCDLTSKQKANGIGCAYYSMRDQCPYDSSKRYFECLP